MNKNFTAYDKSTGRVLFSGHCLDPLTNETQYIGVIDGVAYGDGYIKEGMYHNLPEQPSPTHVFDYSLKQWVDPRTLEQVKSARWAAIKAKRTEVEFGEFTYNGMVFDGDVDAQRRLGSYISVSKTALLNNQPFSASFTLANNTEVVLTAEDFVAIEIAKVTQVAQAFAHAATLRAQINAAASAEEIEAIAW